MVFLCQHGHYSVLYAVIRNPDKTHLKTYLLFFTLTVGKLNDGLMHFQYSWSENLLRKHFCFLKYKAEVDQQCAVFFFLLLIQNTKATKTEIHQIRNVFFFFFLLKCCMEEFSFTKKAAKKHVTKTWFFIRNSNSP